MIMHSTGINIECWLKINKLKNKQPRSNLKVNFKFRTILENKINAAGFKNSFEDSLRIWCELMKPQWVLILKSFLVTAPVYPLQSLKENQIKNWNGFDFQNIWFNMFPRMTKLKSAP